MGFIGRAWRGEEDLWKVYWLYGLVYPVLMLVCIGALTKFNTVADLKSTVLFNILMSIYCFWMCVSLLRCAWNCNWRFWGYWALASAVAYGLNVLNFAISALLIVLPGNSALIGDDSGRKMVEECLVRLEPEAKTAGMGIKDYAKAHPEVMQDCIRQKLGDSKSIPLGSTTQTTTTTTVTTKVSAVPKSVLNNPNDVCEVKLAAHAIDNKLDAKAYVAQNQAWLAQCRQSMAAQPQAQP